jgi:AraC-like DNA-binding protein
MINSSKKCLVIADSENTSIIKSILTPNFKILSAKSIIGITSVLRTNPILCIIIYIKPYSSLLMTELSLIKSRFSVVPMVAIVADYDIELIRHCGEIGIDSVVSSFKIKSLFDIVTEVIKKSNNKIILKDFGINFEQCSNLVKEALLILESYYMEGITVRRIAELLRISENILSREFKKSCKIGLKRLIIYFKIQRALILMKNSGLNLKEISIIAGFSSQRRLNECFNRVVKSSPSVCREKILNNDSIHFINN